MKKVIQRVEYACDGCGKVFETDSVFMTVEQVVTQRFQLVPELLREITTSSRFNDSRERYVLHTCNTACLSLWKAAHQW